MKPGPFLAATLAIVLFAPDAFAGSAKVAVAANFTDAAKEIAASFKKATGHDLVLSFGASGTFAAQIEQDAPFDVLLSADDERPKKLADEKLALADTRFTYAVGKLALWSRDAQRPLDEAALKSNAFTKLAIANPSAAPYGAAAIETLKALKIYDAVRPKIVTGNSIAQTFQFVETGNAELGFVALSQVIDKGGARWLVPQDLYTPIRQDAVLLNPGASNEAARAFLAYLKTPEAGAVIAKFGYAAGGRSGS